MPSAASVTSLGGDSSLVSTSASTRRHARLTSRGAQEHTGRRASSLQLLCSLAGLSDAATQHLMRLPRHSNGGLARAHQHRPERASVRLAAAAHAIDKQGHTHKAGRSSTRPRDRTPSVSLGGVATRTNSCTEAMAKGGGLHSQGGASSNMGRSVGGGLSMDLPDPAWEETATTSTTAFASCSGGGSTPATQPLASAPEAAQAAADAAGGVRVVLEGHDPTTLSYKRSQLEAVPHTITLTTTTIEVTPPSPRQGPQGVTLCDQRERTGVQQGQFVATDLEGDHLLILGNSSSGSEEGEDGRGGGGGGARGLDGGHNVDLPRSGAEVLGSVVRGAQAQIEEQGVHARGAPYTTRPRLSTDSSPASAGGSGDSNREGSSSPEGTNRAETPLSPPMTPLMHAALVPASPTSPKGTGIPPSGRAHRARLHSCSASKLCVPSPTSEGAGAGAGGGSGEAQEVNVRQRTQPASPSPASPSSPAPKPPGGAPWATPLRPRFLRHSFTAMHPTGTATASSAPHQHGVYGGQGAGGASNNANGGEVAASPPSAGSRLAAANEALQPRPVKGVDERALQTRRAQLLQHRPPQQLPGQGTPEVAQREDSMLGAPEDTKPSGWVTSGDLGLIGGAASVSFNEEGVVRCGSSCLGVRGSGLGAIRASSSSSLSSPTCSPVYMMKLPRPASSRLLPSLLAAAGTDSAPATGAGEQLSAAFCMQRASSLATESPARSAGAAGAGAAMTAEWIPRRRASGRGDAPHAGVITEAKSGVNQELLSARHSLSSLHAHTGELHMDPLRCGGDEAGAQILSGDADAVGRGSCSASHTSFTHSSRTSWGQLTLGSPHTSSLNSSLSHTAMSDRGATAGTGVSRPGPSCDGVSLTAGRRRESWGGAPQGGGGGREERGWEGGGGGSAILDNYVAASGLPPTHPLQQPKQLLHTSSSSSMAAAAKPSSPGGGMVARLRRFISQA